MAKAIAPLDTLPSVKLLENITRESAARVIQELSAFKGSRVALEIFSNGGDVHGSQAVAAYISNPANELQVEVRVYGNAASGAMIIAAAAQKAYIDSGAFALVHQARAVDRETGEIVPMADLPKEEAAVLEAMNAEQVRLFRKRTGMTEGAIQKLMEQDRDMTAAEAVEKGFFDGFIPQASRLAAFKNINETKMAEDKKTVTFKVERAELAKAVVTGEVHIPAEQVASAEKETIAERDARISALEKELSELKAAKEADAAKVAEAEAKATDAAKAKELADTEVVAAKAETAKYVAAIEELKKNPLVAQTLADGTQVVVPGSANAPSNSNKSARELELEASANAWAEAKKLYLQ